MGKVVNPEDILPAGDDHTMAVNPFTGFKGFARKGTVAATLHNIALLNSLFLEKDQEDQIALIRESIVALISSLKAVGLFDFFNPLEWIGNPHHLGRTYVALLYLKQYPETITDVLFNKLQEIDKRIQNSFFQLELQNIFKDVKSREKKGCYETLSPLRNSDDRKAKR